MKSKKTIIALIIIALLASAYGIKTWLFAPKVNPNPQQKIVLHGTFPFDKGISLSFQVTYKSTNPTCRQAERVFLIFEAAEVSRTKYIDAQTAKTGVNTFEAIIHKDGVMPGFCKWKYAMVSYAISGNDIRSGFFSAVLSTPVNYRCLFAKRIDNLQQVICLPHKELSNEQHTDQNEVNFTLE